MKFIATTIFGLFVLLSCTDSTSNRKVIKIDPLLIAISDSTEKIALRHLFGKITTLPKASLTGNEILIGDASIRLKINIEFDGQKEGKSIYAANITTTYKASKEIQINVGSIGIGENKNDAIDICIQEWFAVFGMPFTNMLNNDSGLSVSNLKVFSGLMGIRGNLPANAGLIRDKEMTKKIVNQIQEQIKNEAADIVPVDIKLLIGKNGITDGECRISNAVSGQLLESLKQLHWPSSEEGFIFKQFYLIKKG